MKQALLMAALVACLLIQADRCAAQAASKQPAASAAQTSATSTPNASALRKRPLGDVVGAASNQPMVEPQLTHGPSSAEAGEALFRGMNCAYCHGLKAKGVMGPDLTDSYWRYGGTPVMIYKSIAEGRPEGMPAWGHMLSPTAIWEIVAYIESLGGAYPESHEEAAMEGDLAKGATQPGAGLLPATQGSY